MNVLDWGGTKLSIEILKQEIDKGFVRNLYLFYGSEEYLKRHYIKELEKLTIAGGIKEMNYSMFDEKINIESVINASQTLPFMSEKRLIVIKNSKWFKSQAKEESDNKSSQIEGFLKKIPETSVVVFCEEEVDKRRKTVDLIKKNGLMVECLFQKPEVLVKWARKTLKLYGKEADNKDLEMLIDYCEPGMDYIINEIEKLASYVGEREKITEKEIKEVCHRSIKSRVFDLIDAIGAKKPEKAMRILHEMLELREPIQMIFHLSRKHFFNVLEAKIYMDKGEKGQSLAKILGVAPFISNKLAAQAAYFEEDTLRKAVLECSQMDIDMKNSRIDEVKAIEILISNYATK